MLIIREHLKKKISNYNLIPLEVSALNISNQIFLEIDEIEEFLKFASDSNCEHVYYHYTYYNSEEYIIPLDWYDEQTNKFQNTVKKHNQLIESLDFGYPNSLSLFILQNGTFVGIKLHDPWIEEKGIESAEDTIETIENEFYREVEALRESKKDKQKDDENKLRGIIFNDPEFGYCKNQHLRYYYLVELLEKENMKKYEYLVQPYGAPHVGKIKMFMDKTWMLYKERKKYLSK